jgi:hypothetical protein
MDYLGEGESKEQKGHLTQASVLHFALGVWMEKLK